MYWPVFLEFFFKSVPQIILKESQPVYIASNITPTWVYNYFLLSYFFFSQFTCDECKQGVTALGQYLQTPNEIAAVEQALSDLVCPTLPEDKIEACIDFVYSNWEAMATALFAYENTLTDICGALGYCTKFQRVLKEYI